MRGLAIVGVVSLHSSIWGDVPSLLPGGALGVTVFFVLSGFLITTLLLAEHARDGRIDLRAFYFRRAARLLPALLVLLPVYVIVFARQLSLDQLLLTVGATLLYLSSFIQSIWGAMGNLGWTWSLSVEEHFYVLWPPVLRWLLGGEADRGTGVRGRLRRRPLLTASVLALGIVAASVALRAILGGSFRGREFAYYATPTRIDALAVGCLVAIFAHQCRPRLPAVLGWAALAAIGWCYLNPSFAIGGEALNLWGLPVCTVSAAVLILSATSRPDGLLSRALSWRPLVHLGTISYGLYLWNLLPGQTFHLLAGRHPGALGTIGCAVIILIVVELSYWGVERPFLRWAKRRMASGPRPPADRAARTAQPTLARHGRDGSLSASFRRRATAS